MDTQKHLLAFVGMPGSGKSHATAYLSQKGFPSVRFGDLADEGLKAQGEEINPENEQRFREALRAEKGMAAFAIGSLEKITKMMNEATVGVIDGLYSWEEYTFLKEKFPLLTIIHVYAEPVTRYKRLSERSVRPLNQEEAKKRDILELERLNKGGPIAMADHLIVNNSNTVEDLNRQIDMLLERLQIKV